MSKNKKYYHRKLVRDKVPQYIEKRKEEYEAMTLKKRDHKQLLRKKLLEESTEVANAEENNLINELADVLQVIKSIADFENISFERIERKRVDKEKIFGAFKKGIFLVWSNKPADKK